MRLICAALSFGTALSVTITTPALAAAGDTFVRVRAIMVAPNEKSGPILPAFPSEKVKINNSVMPEIDITHMVINA